MSKKSKRKKLKKKFKQLLRQRLAEQQSQATIEPKITVTKPQPIVVSPKTAKTPEIKKEASPASAKPQTLTQALNPYVKPDLIRIGIYLSIFIAILIITAVLNQKTTWLATLANKIYFWLHLG